MARFFPSTYPRRRSSSKNARKKALFEVSLISATGAEGLTIARRYVFVACCACARGNVPASNKPAMNSRRLIRSPRRCPADHGALGIPHSGPVLMSGAKPLYSSTSYHGSRDGGSRADGTGKPGHHEFRDGLSRPAASERLATSISLAVGRRPGHDPAASCPETLFAGRWLALR